MKLVISASSWKHGFHELDKKVWERVRKRVEQLKQLLATNLLRRNQFHDMNLCRERDVFLDRKEWKKKVLDLKCPSISQWLKNI